MNTFFKNNWKLLLMITVFGMAILGGISYVESSLAGQEVILD